MPWCERSHLELGVVEHGGLHVPVRLVVDGVKQAQLEAQLESSVQGRVHIRHAAQALRHGVQQAALTVDGEGWKVGDGKGVGVVISEIAVGTGPALVCGVSSATVHAGHHAAAPTALHLCTHLSWYTAPLQTSVVPLRMATCAHERPRWTQRRGSNRTSVCACACARSPVEHSRRRPRLPWRRTCAAGRCLPAHPSRW